VRPFRLLTGHLAAAPGMNTARASTCGTAAAPIGIRAPARTDPQTLSPHPPTGNLRIEEIGLARQSVDAQSAFSHEPPMPSVKVCFVDGPIGPPGDMFRIGLNRAPEVREVRILVVDGFHAWLVRPTEQDCQAACERLDVILDVAQSWPHQMRGAALAAEPGEGRFQLQDVTADRGNSRSCSDVGNSAISPPLRSFS